MNDSNQASGGDPRGGQPAQDLQHEQLVALALGELAGAEAERLRARLSEDPAAATEFAEINAHFALHDQVETLTPPPQLWTRIRDEIDRSAPRSFFERIWMPAAAAALIALAFLVPSSEGGRTADSAIRATTFGSITALDGGGYRTDSIARITLDGQIDPDGGASNGSGTGRAVVTIDGDCRFSLPESGRLALGAGRVFLDVSEELSEGAAADGGAPRTPFVVEAGPLQVVTTGTAYLVERTGEEVFVAVVRGSVRCEWADGSQDVTAGQQFVWSKLTWPKGACAPTTASEVTAWFQTPALAARIVDERNIEVVVRNDMPDPIVLAAPADGEPLFYASFTDRQIPLNPIVDGPGRSPILDGPLTLQPRTKHVFKLRLPHPLPVREALVILYPAKSLRVRAVDPR